jgi:hypothetical protein
MYKAKQAHKQKRAFLETAPSAPVLEMATIQ